MVSTIAQKFAYSVHCVQSRGRYRYIRFDPEKVCPSKTFEVF